MPVFAIRHGSDIMPSGFRRCVVLCVSVIAAVPLPAVAEQWLVISGASYHFRQNERDWRQFNPGIGYERATSYDGLYCVGGYFKNSYDRHALYAGVRWMPYEWAGIKFGGYALAATGYPSPVLVLPGFSIEGKDVGLNVVALPNIGNYSGYVGMQVRVRLD